MKIFGHNRYLYLSPEDDVSSGAAAGTATPPAPPPPPAPETFTQDQVNNREAKLRRSLERKMREQEAEFTKRLEAMEAKLKASPPPPPPSSSSAPSTEEGRIELLEARFARKEEELNARLAQQEALAAQETKRRKDLERDRQLDDALSAAGVSEKNVKLARRYFGPDIYWDELDQDWRFKSPTGNPLSIVEGVQEYLPENLKPSRIANGGAGTQGGLPGRAARVQRDLEEAQKKLAILKAEALARPKDNALLTKFSEQKALVRRMETDAKASNR